MIADDSGNITSNSPSLVQAYLRRTFTDGTLSPKLTAILAEGLLVKDDCYFIAECVPNALPDMAQFQDRTGLECFINKVTIYEENPAILEEQGFLYAHSLMKILTPLGNFKIILDFNESDFGNAPNKTTCNTRFHKIRTGESWLLDDLFSYRENRLVVIDTSIRPS